MDSAIVRRKCRSPRRYQQLNAIAKHPPQNTDAKLEAKSAERKHTWLEIFAVGFAFLAVCATAWQGWVARDTEKRQLRAYVLPSDSKIVVTAPNTLEAHLTLKNFGSTPAYELRGWYCVIIGRFSRDAEGNLGIETDFPVPPFNEKTAQANTFGPQDTKHIVFGNSFCDGGIARVRSITQDEVARIQRGTAAVYLYGEQHYLDAFGEPHFTKYRIVGFGGGGTFDAQEGNNSN